MGALDAGVVEDPHEVLGHLLEEWAEHATNEGMRSFSRKNLRWVVGVRSMHRFWPAMQLLGPIAFDLPAEAFVSQIQAILDADDSLRSELHHIAVPTLVIVGSQDILTPQGDSEEIASLIPGSRLAVVRGGAHGFMVEHAGDFNRAILDFLAEVGDGTPVGAGTHDAVG